jgi:hypothetical protein
MFPPFEEDRMPDDRYIWFGPDTVRELKARLNGASDDAVLKIDGHGERTTLEVVDPAQDAAARLKPLNEAHICPPQCI